LRVATVCSCPPDPPWRADGGELHEGALRWWAVWCETPQATVFTDVEWERLADTALLVDRYWRATDMRTHLALIREIFRREEEELGWVGPAYRQCEGRP
jgi:hypothetical protein